MKKISIAPGCVFSPQPMFLIGTNNEDGTPNFAVITWVGFSWDGGPCIMMSIGGTKRTKTNILREGRFSANLVSRDILPLADYFGCSRGEAGPKSALPYAVSRGEKADVPLLDASRWSYECEVIRVMELDGAHLFLAAIRNICIDESLADMDLKHIDLNRLDAVIYSPYQYYAGGERLGEIGDWKIER